jgi:RNA polymerase II subunit A-like phosphatase
MSSTDDAGTRDRTSNSSNSSNSSNTATANILLPDKDYVVQTWKVQPGTSVRKGETVAISIRRDSVGATATGAATFTFTNGAAGAAPAQHKRPNRRRKIAPAAATAAPHVAVAVAAPPTGITQTRADQGPQNVAANLHQRLAEKLDQRSSQKQSQLQSAAVAVAVNSSSESSPKAMETTIPLLAPADGILRISQNTSQVEEQFTDVVAYIEECLHPGFLEGLCVVCGASVMRNNNSNNNNEPNNGHSLSNSASFSEDTPKSSLVTVSGGVTITVSQQEGRHMAQQDSERLLKQQKLSLVLDLDHTLVHATSDPRARQFCDDDVRTLRLPIMEGMPNQQHHNNNNNKNVVWMQHFAKLRPHVREFLEIVQPMYELTVYTAGTRHYAEEITIVLCRHLVGSRRDIDDLERLRYELHMAEMEYRRHNSLGDDDGGGDDDKQDHKKGGDTANGDDKQTTTTTTTTDDSMETETEDSKKKRKSDEMVTESDKEITSAPAPKRKKVCFGPPPDGDGDDPSSDDNHDNINSNNRSDHMTLARLRALRQELREAEDLERQAWEMRQRVFGSRVVSRTDVGDLGRDVKSLKRIFPCGGTMAAVIDDREDVWANATDNSYDTIRGEPPDNLLLVRPYHWKPFVGFADINNAAGDDLSGNGPINGTVDTKAETDVQLIWTSRILRGLHRRFYNRDENNRKTVPEILSMMRREVLKGSGLVLSGLVPLHKKAIGANSARPPIVRYAQSMGAKLLDNVQPGVTHVVAAKDGTDKALAARKTPGCSLVKPAWLVECYWSMTRRDVKIHLMGKGEGPDPSMARKQQQPLTESKVDNSSEGTSGTDSDDDELAAALEEEMMNG